MRIRTAAVATTVVLAFTATACSGDSTDESSASPKASLSASAGELSEDQKADIREAAGLPPTPQPAQWAAYIKALNAIDPDIVHGKEDKAVSRGIDTCSTYKRYPGDSAQQLKATRQRFTSPTHPEGRSAETAQLILDAAHKHICPSY
ncbi:hypothetical protein ACIQ6Y_15330 [Streptomyces sp. NPDC096205]|uniref:hypothetical protein n=1 Tax=Streptomyces sp. NPDC096205 TaxID=3366081 RepID=UPI0037F7AB36